MHRRPQGRSKSRVVLILLLLSVLGIVLPTSVSSHLSGAIQVLVPIQHGLSRLTARSEQPPVAATADGSTDLQRQLAAARNQVASLQLQVNELTLENQHLARLRRDGFEQGQLIPARIVACDSLSFRDSRLINRGTLKGVRRGSAVVSQYCVDAGAQLGVDAGMMVLAGETLIGRIEHVSTHSASLLLVTDPASTGIVVKIARQDKDGWHFTPQDAGFLMKGLGDGRMQINDVDRRYVEQGLIREGDMVLVTDVGEPLPVPVVTGRVEDIHEDDDNRVLSRLTVRPELDMRALTKVYVIEP